MSTGAAERDGAGVEAGGDGWRGLDVEDDEGSWVRLLRLGSEAEVLEGPPEGIHALLASVDGDHHAAKVASRHGRDKQS